LPTIHWTIGGDPISYNHLGATPWIGPDNGTPPRISCSAFVKR
jgi:hypothetical protein